MSNVNFDLSAVTADDIKKVIAGLDSGLSAASAVAVFIPGGVAVVEKAKAAFAFVKPYAQEEWVPGFLNFLVRLYQNAPPAVKKLFEGAAK